MEGRHVLTCVFVCAVAAAVSAQAERTVVSEWAEYRLTEGGAASALRQTVEPAPGGSVGLSVKSEWGTRSTETFFELPGMFLRTFTRETVREGNRLRTSVSFDGRWETKGVDALVVLDYDNLFFALRNYPFDAPRQLKVLVPGHQDANGAADNFQVFVQYVGAEKVQAAGRSIECHKLSLVFKLSGIMSVFAPMIPKTFYWYSVQDPHVLVKYIGVNGPPGSPELTRTITAYSRW